MRRPNQRDSVRQKCCSALGIIDLFHSPDQLRILRSARGTAFFYRAASILRNAGYSKSQAAKAATNADYKVRSASA